MEGCQVNRLRGIHHRRMTTPVSANVSQGFTFTVTDTG
jgi:hypothetical protein